MGSLVRSISRVFISATATVTPSSPSPPTPPPPIKLIPSPKLKKRSQWSVGDAPGEYGGPPLVTQLRKSYGGNEEDPLTSSGDYIWNKKWQPYLDPPPSGDQLPARQEIADSNTGFLSLNRAIALDNMEVDLSQELMKPSKATLQHQVEAARKATGLREEEKTAYLEKPRWRFAPTRREEARWERAEKARPRDRDTLGEVSVTGGEDLIQQEQRYLKLKSNLQLFTLGVGAIGATSASIIYTPDTAASYGVGLLGAVAYVRMLGNSVDAFGGRDVGGALRGAVGQPRLLIPVLLTMIYNRWNEILTPEYGFVHLQLIPMLVGFFTYKLATILAFLRDIIPAVKYESEP